jgi:hypothetical protein
LVRRLQIRVNKILFCAIRGAGELSIKIPQNSGL